MESVSEELNQTLTSLGLATHSDLKRCRPLVRRFARDLPVIDALWIDALVRRRVITPWQAQHLENKTAEQLYVEPDLVLVSPRHLDPVMPTFDARAFNGRRFIVSTIQELAGDLHQSLERLERKLPAIQAARRTAAGIPLRAIGRESQLLIVAEQPRGEALGRFLVRRGRFPESAVRAIARELARVLSVDASVPTHGDLRLSNVWLAADGTISVLHWGVLSTLVPELTIHARLPEDAYDGIAPERLDGRNAPTTTTDLYALGCLLWQLLAGRPPYLSADPLDKFACHRTRMIPDIRTAAPETSEEMAALLRSLTAREPHRRPQTFEEIRQVLPGNSSQDRSRLARFAREFESAAPARMSDVPRQKRRSPLTTAAVVVLMTVTLAGLAWSRNSLGLPSLVSLSAATASVSPDRSVPQQEAGGTAVLSSNENLQTHDSSTDVESGSSDTVVTADKQPDSRDENVLRNGKNDLPFPDEQGLVILDDSAPYTAGILVAHGTLVIEGRPFATIEIGEVPLQVAADRVVLRNVRLIDEHTESPSPSRDQAVRNADTLVRVAADELYVQGCRFQADKASSSMIAMEWDFEASENPRAGRFLIRETAIVGPQIGLRCLAPLSTGRLDQVLYDAAGGLLTLEAGVQSGWRVPLVIDNTTLREASSVVTIRTPTPAAGQGKLAVQGTNSVLALREGQPVVLFEGARDTAPVSQRCEFAATGLILRSGTPLLGRREHSDGDVLPLDSSDVPVSGILSGAIDFPREVGSGSPSSHPRVEGIPLRDPAQPPGVDLSRLMSFGDEP